MDDFAVNVFLPQIEEKVMQLIQHATVGLDAFQDARDYKNYSKYPIAKVGRNCKIMMTRTNNISLSVSNRVLLL